MSVIRIGYITRVIPILFTLLVSCGTVSEVIHESSIAIGGHNQMMLVRQNPPSYGYQRMQVLGEIHQEIQVFLKVKNVPDFFAETFNTGEQYCLFYYLGKRHAYICRITGTGAKKVRFSGPYPVTDKELKLLSDFQRSHPASLVKR
jgi:hypothetical protein